MNYYRYNRQNAFRGITQIQPDDDLWTLIEPTHLIIPIFNGTEWTEGANQEQLSQAQADTVQFQKEECYKELLPTDWYFIRKSETGQDIPQFILDERAAIRAKYNT